MTAYVPETSGIESLAIWLGKFFQLLSLADKGPFPGLETPLLLVSDRLIAEKHKQHHGRERIPPSEGDFGTHRHKRGESNHKHKEVLVHADKEQVEQHPLPVRLKLFAAPQHFPAVVFPACPELDMVGPFAGKVESQAGAPEGYEAGHNDQARTHSALGGNNPHIDCRKYAPELVHLAVVGGKLANRETEQRAAGSDDKQGLEDGQLNLVQRGPHIEIKQRARNN